MIFKEIPLATTEPSITPEPKNTVDPHQIMTRTISVNDSDDQSFEENGLREMRERKVMFKAATQGDLFNFSNIQN